jgi:hypothetical protein
LRVAHCSSPASQSPVQSLVAIPAEGRRTKFHS